MNSIYKIFKCSHIYLYISSWIYSVKLLPSVWDFVLEITCNHSNVIFILLLNESSLNSQMNLHNKMCCYRKEGMIFIHRPIKASEGSWHVLSQGSGETYPSIDQECRNIVESIHLPMNAGSSQRGPWGKSHVRESPENCERTKMLSEQKGSLLEGYPQGLKDNACSHGSSERHMSLSNPSPFNFTIYQLPIYSPSRAWDKEREWTHGWRNLITFFYPAAVDHVSHVGVE